MYTGSRFSSATIRRIVVTLVFLVSVTLVVGVPAGITSVKGETLAVSIAGRGKVIGSPSKIVCPSKCTARIPSRVIVRLKAKPASGWAFSSWKGRCSSAKSRTCRLSLSSRTVVLAVFQKRAAPKAAFTPSKTSGAAPLTVTFTNKSTNATSYSWNFGDGATSTAVSPTHTYTVPGTRTVTLTAKGAGGSSRATASIKVSNAPALDTSPPSVSLTSPASGSTVSGKVTLVAQASDDVGVSRVDFYLGTIKLSSLAASPYQLGWDSTSVADGSYQLSAFAFDAAGNQASSTVSIKVSNAPAPSLLFSDGFDSANGANNLITNEYTYWNPGSSGIVTSPNWEMTSGSFFSVNGLGWSGVPDVCDPDRLSQTCTDSAIFRLTTKRADFGNVMVNMKLKINSLTSTSETPAVDWDGIHIFLRYQSEYSLYYASVARRDGSVVIKKKCVGGSDNGGTYYELTSYVSGHPIPFGSWINVGASIVTNSDGSVTIGLYRDGSLLAQDTDSGKGCAAITAPGKVGIRGDNADFNIDDFTVSSIP
jgi:PKD repeat protein